MSVISTSCREWCVIIAPETRSVAVGVYVLGKLLRLESGSFLDKLKDMMAVNEHSFWVFLSRSPYSSEGLLELG